MAGYLTVISSSSSDSSDDEPLLITKRRLSRGNAKAAQNVPNKDVKSTKVIPTKTFQVYTSEIDKFCLNKKNYRAGINNLKKIGNDDDDEDEDEDDILSSVKSKKRPPRNCRKKVVVKDSDEDSDSKGSPPKLAAMEDSFDKEISKLPKPISRRKSNATEKLLENLTNATKQFYTGLTTAHVLDTSADIDASIHSREIMVKIRCRTAIERFPLHTNEPLRKLLPALSNLYNVPENKLMLTLHNNQISIDETPDSLNLVIADIIQCYSMSDITAAQAASVMSSVPPAKDPNIIELMLQSKNDRKKTTIECHKAEPLQKVLEKYASEKGLDIATLILKFDGENVDLDDSPNDLDMDDGDCVDVIVTS